MRKFTVVLSAAWVAMAALGFAPVSTTAASRSLADCPSGWYWDSYRQNCLPPGLPKDPPSGCLTGDGTHLNGTICVN